MHPSRKNAMWQWIERFCQCLPWPLGRFFERPPGKPAFKPVTELDPVLLADVQAQAERMRQLGIFVRPLKPNETPSETPEIDTGNPYTH